MKTLAIGDIHGRNTWQHIVKLDKFDHIVFIGDYFDSREGISADEQIKNFKNILTFKHQTLSEVTLLMGNHDYHYLACCPYKYSNYQASYALEIMDLLEKSICLRQIQIAKQIGKVVYTHAGVSKTWAKNNKIDLLNIDKSINTLFDQNPKTFDLDYRKNFDPSGDNEFQSPIWIRPLSLINNSLKNVKQVVGHTNMSTVFVAQEIAFIDTMSDGFDYLVIEDDDFIVKSFFQNTDNY